MANMKAGVSGDIVNGSSGVTAVVSINSPGKHLFTV